MSRRNNPYDNDTCESFIRTLKDEKVYLWKYKTIENTKTSIYHFTKDMCDEKRLPSSFELLSTN